MQVRSLRVFRARVRRARRSGATRLELLNPAPLLSADPFDEAPRNDDDAPAYCAAPSPSTRAQQHAPTGSKHSQRSGRHARAGGGSDASRPLRGLLLVSGPRHLHRAKKPQPRRAPVRHARDVRGQTKLDSLKDLGFTDACAQIWSFNIENTRAKCMGTCVATLPTKHKLRRELERLPRVR